MKKIKKTFMYLLGLLLALVFEKSNVFAITLDSVPAYGVQTVSTAELFGRIFTYIILPILIILALIIGIIVYIRRKNKNVKKDY